MDEVAERSGRAGRVWRNLLAALVLLAVIGIIGIIVSPMLVGSGAFEGDALPWVREALMADLEASVRESYRGVVDEFALEYQGGSWWSRTPGERSYRGTMTVTGSPARYVFEIPADRMREVIESPSTVLSSLSVPGSASAEEIVSPVPEAPREQTAPGAPLHHAFSHEEIGGTGRFVELAREYGADFGAERFDYAPWSRAPSYEFLEPVIDPGIARSRIASAAAGEVVVAFAIVADEDGTERARPRAAYRWLEAGNAWQIVYADPSAFR